MGLVYNDFQFFFYRCSLARIHISKGITQEMYEETLRKFREQVEMLSRDDVEKVAKRLDKEELSTLLM